MKLLLLVKIINENYYKHKLILTYAARRGEKMKKYLLMALAIVLFTQCSKKEEPPIGPTPSGTDGNYFGTPDGSFWIYTNDSISMDGTVHRLDKNDTLKQVGNTTYLGISGKLMNHHFVNVFEGGNANTTEYAMIEDGSKLYVSKGFLSMFIPTFLVEIFEVLDTIKLADGNATTWYLAEIDAPDLMELLGMPSSFVVATIPVAIKDISGKFKIGFTRGANVMKNGYNTNSFTMKVAIEGEVLVDALNLVDFPLEYRTVFSEIDFYLAEGKGLIEVEAKPMEIKTVITLPPPMNAFVSTYEVPSPMNIIGLKKTLIQSGIE